MDLNNDPLMSDRDDALQQNTDSKPNAYRVDDDGNADEASLKRNYFIGGEMKDANAPGMEGEGSGGEKFGHENHPPTGDDPANPSRNAGYTNAYLARTKPMEEHPENNNFKDENQQGEPNYQAPKLTTPDEDNNQEKQKETEDGNTAKQEQNQRDTDNGSNAPEIPGPGEKPEQQKVGGA